MDPAVIRGLARLVRGQRTAALGTYCNDYPMVSLILYAYDPQVNAFYIHISHMARHTASIRRDPRVGLLISECPQPGRNPQNLARISIHGQAESLEPETSEHERAQAIYISELPTSSFNFTLGGFVLVRIRPEGARYTAGFAHIYDLDDEAWQELATYCQMVP